ncbi:MAG: tetratricopeptide repeat protein [Alphaproteobacteria bacterium]
MKLFTSGEVAKILNLPPTRIRSFVRAGFITPVRERRALRFTFKDLIFLKTAKGLLESSVPSHRIVRMLSSLKRQVPPERHLSSIKIYADGRRIVVWDGTARWQPDSGQFLFDFSAGAIAQNVALARLARKTNGPRLTADHWYNLGVELESTSTHEAEKAYLMAIEIDPRMANAHLNLGKLYHDDNELKKAEAHYRAAGTNAPKDPAPRFNLGVLMEDLQRPLDAVRAYREAIHLDPAFADAHYNLGLLCESLGKKTEALAHLRSARKLYRAE